MLQTLKLYLAVTFLLDAFCAPCLLRLHVIQTWPCYRPMHASGSLIEIVRTLNFSSWHLPEPCPVSLCLLVLKATESWLQGTLHSCSRCKSGHSTTPRGQSRLCCSHSRHRCRRSSPHCCCGRARRRSRLPCRLPCSSELVGLRSQACSNPKAPHNPLPLTPNTSCIATLTNARFESLLPCCWQPKMGMFIRGAPGGAAAIAGHLGCKVVRIAVRAQPVACA